MMYVDDAGGVASGGGVGPPIIEFKNIKNLITPIFVTPFVRVTALNI